MTAFTLYDFYEDFVVSCTLSVNTSACLSRRRVGTGVFADQTCAENRNRSKSYRVNTVIPPHTTGWTYFVLRRISRILPPETGKNTKRILEYREF